MPKTIRIRAITMTPLEQTYLVAGNRMNSTYYEDQFLEVEAFLRAAGAVPLGQFIPDEHADGSKGITYGQVGARHLDPEGGVRYLQVINIRDTGIDFAIKPDRVAEGSHNDPPRSRVRPGDILFTNNAFRGTDTLLGRCVVVCNDYGNLNISQHINRIRVQGINAFYVCAFLKTGLGMTQIDRVIHGVDSSGISFGRIKAILIKPFPTSAEHEVETQYREMSKCHDRAMAIKERLLEESGVAPGQYGEAINALADAKPSYRRALGEARERLGHLVQQVELVVAGKGKRLAPFPD